MTRSRLRRTARRLARGYTIVELMMSLTVLAIGASGVIAMQKVTLSTNRHAKNLSIATRVAQAWADQLTADAALWTPGLAPRDATTWLDEADPDDITEWFIPEYSSTRDFGPEFDALGNPVDPADSAGIAHFCTHLRFAFMHSETTPAVGNGAIRAQVRIFWRRDDGTADPPGGASPCAIDDAEFIDGQDQLHVVYLTTAVRESRRAF